MHCVSSSIMRIAGEIPALPIEIAEKGSPTWLTSERMLDLEIFSLWPSATRTSPTASFEMSLSMKNISLSIRAFCPSLMSVQI